MPRPRRKKSKIYFGTPAQEAIIEYNNCKDPRKKSKIYDGFDSLVNKSKAHQVTLVPDSADQITSDSGWTSTDKFDELKHKIRKYKKNNSRVSIFINPSLTSYSFARSLNPDAIEIYTGPFAQIVKSGNKNKLNHHIYIIDEIINLALIDGILVNAGHDLNLDNLKYLVELSGFNEFSIGCISSLSLSSDEPNAITSPLASI